MRTLLLLQADSAGNAPWGVFKYIELAFGLFLLYFCYKMIFDAIYNQPAGSKWMWVFIILAFNIIGAVLYYYKIKKPRDAKGGRLY